LFDTSLFYLILGGNVAFFALYTFSNHGCIAGHLLNDFSLCLHCADL